MKVVKGQVVLTLTDAEREQLRKAMTILSEMNEQIAKDDDTYYAVSAETSGNVYEFPDIDILIDQISEFANDTLIMLPYDED